MKHSGPIWSVSQSIALELDAVLGTAVVDPLGEKLPSPAEELRASLSPDWLARWPEMLGAPRRWLMTLTWAARLAGVWEESDYSRATLAIRDLSAEEALARLSDEMAPYGVAPDSSLGPKDRLIDLISRTGAAFATRWGLQPVSRESQARASGYEAGRVVRILRGGDLHTRFWHWLDEGYYTWYRPWRESVAEVMRAQEERALAALGSRQGSPDQLRIDWLPPQNPLYSFPELLDGVKRGELRLLLWTQPFGYYDLWSMAAGHLMVTYAEPNQIFDEFRTRVEALSERVKALSDPTRLSIMRLIRTYAKDNTQMADYLGIARPTVSIHAKILREAGLIESHQEGRAARHTVNAAEVRRLFRDLLQFLDLPDET